MNSATPSTPSETQVRDDRGPAHGLGRLVMAAFWIFGVVVTGLAIWGFLSPRFQNQPLGARLIALLAGALYVAVAVGITHNGRKMRMMAWSGLMVSLAGPVVTGLLNIGLAEPVGAESAWADFGAEFWFLPLVMPLVGIVWMWRSEPRRIVELAEKN